MHELLKEDAFFMYRSLSKISRAYSKLTLFWDVLIFESCLFSSHACLKVAQFLDMLIFKYWIFLALNKAELDMMHLMQ